MNCSKVILFLGLTFIVNACQFPTAQMPVGLEITNDDCVISCWNGLTIGDSEEYVKMYYSVDFSKFDIYQSGNYDLYYAVRKGVYTVSSYVSDGRLEIITLTSPVNFDFSIEKMIQKLGDPLYVMVSYGRSVVTPDVYPYIMLYFPENGYVFRVNLAIKSRSASHIETCVEPLENPSDIYIIKNDSIREVVNAVHRVNPLHMDLEGIEDYINSLEPWDGYKCYTLLSIPN